MNTDKNKEKYGGSIREAGGSFGSYASAKEEAYFREQDKIKIEELKKRNEQEKTKQTQSSNQ